MNHLKAEFDDHRVCKKCGSPAEKFMVMTPEGYRHRTVTANYRDPVSYTCCNDITDGCPSGGDHGVRVPRCSEEPTQTTAPRYAPPPGVPLRPSAVLLIHTPLPRLRPE